MESFEKRELIRVVRTPDETICLDFKGKASGRGAYICKNAAGLRTASAAAQPMTKGKRMANRYLKNRKTAKTPPKPTMTQAA